MDPGERARRFAALIRKEKGMAESSEVSRQSTSIAEPGKAEAQILPVETATLQGESGDIPKEKKRKSKGEGSRKKKKKLFPADPERKRLDSTAPEETKLMILEQESGSKELAEGKIFITWPASMSWLTLWKGYVWGIPFSIDEILMESYEYMWYPRYYGGVGVGYGNPDAIELNVLGIEPTRHPVPQLGQHFVSESSQSQSLDVSGTERLISCLLDFAGAERAFGESENLTEGLSQRRSSMEDPAAETTATPLLIEGPINLGAGAELPAKDNLGSTEAVEGVQEVQEVQVNESTDPVIETDETISAVPATSTVEQVFQLERLEESTGIDTSTGAPEEKSQDLGPVDITAVVDPAGDPKVTVSLIQLERFMEKYMMKRLSNNWSLDAYRNKMDDCVKRSHENKDSIQKLDQRLDDFGDVLKNIQKDIAELRDGDTAHEAVAGNLRRDIDLAMSCHNALTAQVNQLHTATEKHSAENLVVLGDIHKMSAENTSNWSKHEVVHMAADARLSSLEELRRLDNISRGQEKISDYYSIKMEGFQECLEVQISNGTFNRRLLDNADFMSLVKDKSALMAKLAEKDKQIPWRGGPSQRK